MKLQTTTAPPLTANRLLAAVLPSFVKVVNAKSLTIFQLKQMVTATCATQR